MESVALFLAGTACAAVALVAILCAVDGGEWLNAAPMPAKVCPNCSAYYLNFRCESCSWTDPDAKSDAAEEEPDADPTDLEPTQPEDQP